MKKYETLYNNIIREIEDSKYPIGSKLPTEYQLMQQYGYSRQTVRQALKLLEENGQIERIQGSGSFIADVVKTTSHKRIRQIAVITKYINGETFSAFFHAVEALATKNKYSILLFTTYNSVTKEHDILAGLSNKNVDGILVQGSKSALPNPNFKMYENLLSQGVSVVFHNNYYPDLFHKSCPNLAYVVADDQTSSFEMTSCLIESGHEKIIAIFKSDDQQGLRRFSGYMNAFIQKNLAIDDRYIFWFSTETIDHMESILSGNHCLSECTALICYNDQIVAQTIPILHKISNSIRVIRSFDNTINPSLVSDYDFYSMPSSAAKLGEVAVKKLFSMIEGNTEDSILLPWKIIQTNKNGTSDF